MARLIEPPGGAGPVGPFERLVIETFLRDLPDDYLLLPNFIVKEPDRYALEYDLVVIAPHAIYVIEAKKWYGRVSGDDTEWLLNGRPRRCLLEQVNLKAKVLKDKVGPFAGPLSFIELVVVPDKCSIVLRGGWKGHLLNLSRAARYLQHDKRFGLRGGNSVLSHHNRLVRAIQGAWGERRRGVRRRVAGYRVEETLRLSDDYCEYLCAHALIDTKERYRVRLWRLSAYQSKDARAQRLEVVRRPSQALADIGPHPNLVRVLAFDELPDENAFYEVTEWTESGTLHGYMKNQERDRLTLRQRLEIGAGIAQGLEAVHAKGVVHRNLSPESVLIGPGLRAMLTDFDRAFLPSGESTVFAKTEPSNSAYIAPELADTRQYETHPKADLYSLGAILYELFIGQPPFSSPAAALAAQGEPDRLPSEERAGVPDDLDTLILDLINVEQQHRPTTAETVERLTRMLLASDETATPRPEPEPEPPSDPYAFGSILADKFRVDDELGEGGFSKVLKVWHFDHETHYAMKLLHPGTHADAAIRELQAGHQLDQHDNIARTIWMDRLPPPEATPYVLTEFIDGESLEPYCDGRKTLPLSQVRDIGLQLLDALATMHPQTERIQELRDKTLTDAESAELMELKSKGILHRDIKPANILLEAWTGRPKLIDFNIAAHVAEAEGFGGTPRYWARDRGMPKWLPDADLFSLGVVLFELATHTHPYPNATPDHGEPVDPRKVTDDRRQLSDEFAAFLLKSVQPHRDERFQTAREMAAALREIAVLNAAPAPAATSTGDEYPGITLLPGEEGQANYNPYVTRLLSLYSQARRTNAGTRGLDDIARLTYVQTRMDKALAPAILDGQFRLVIITGNAGDGKTAFLEQLEQLFERAGANVSKLPTGNGAEWTFDGIHYLSNYDGSQDEGDTDNDEVLGEFLGPFSGASLAGLGSNEARLIAINEGRLRDFLLHSPNAVDFDGLRGAVRAALDGTQHPHDRLLVVNLNLRALAAGGPDSLVDAQLTAMLSDVLWAPCDVCALADHCPIKHNVATLRDPATGPEVIGRLRRLFEVLHLRRQQHMTMRDLRSTLAWFLLRDRSCEDIADLLSSEDARPEDVVGIYYHQAFAEGVAPEGRVQDRVVRLLQDIDVGRLENPALDRRLFHGVDTAVPWLAFDARSTHDVEVRQAVSGGTLDTGDTPDTRAALHAQRDLMRRLRRWAYFERRDDAWEGMLPYRSLSLMEQAILSDSPEVRSKARATLRNRIVEAISLLEGVRHPGVRQQFLCLRATRTKNASVFSFRLFPREEFEVVVDEAADLDRYIEMAPDGFRLVSTGRFGHAEMRVSLDLLEMLEQIRSGYRPTPADMRGLFVNLLIFRNELLHLPYKEVLITEDGERFYAVAADHDESGLSLRLEPRSANELGRSS